MVFNIWKVGGLYEPLPVILPQAAMPTATTPVNSVQALEQDLLQDPNQTQHTWVDRDSSQRNVQEKAQKKQEWHLQEDWNAGQFMSFPVVTLREDATLKEAWDIVVQKRFRHIPIVDHRNRLVGLVSDRDLLKKAALIGKKKDHEPIGKIAVREAMSKPVVAAESSTLLTQIGLIFLRRRIGCMPITDHEGHLIGILTRSDLLRAMLGIKKEDLR